MQRETIGSLVVDVEGIELTAEDKDLINHPCVGGVILFKRNYVNKIQLRELCAEIRAARGRPILIMADQEGGRVQRFTTEFTKIPPSAYFGNLYDQDVNYATQFTKDIAWLLANELLEVGIDLSLSPVADLKKINPAIADRAFHNNPNITSILTLAWMQGLHNAGMAAVAKHFPGHGSVLLDSHLDLPIDGRPLRDIEKEDLIPFEYLIKKDLRAVMAAHIIYPEIDSMPVNFSKIWLQDILRQQLKFTNAIFSDDLNMAGAAVVGEPLKRVRLARQSGCDFILFCNQRNTILTLIEKLNIDEYQVPKSTWSVLKADTPKIFSKDDIEKLQRVREQLHISESTKKSLQESKV